MLSLITGIVKKIRQALEKEKNTGIEKERTKYAIRERSYDRYTYRELRTVVGLTPKENWTDDQMDRLEALRNTRIAFAKAVANQRTIQMQEECRARNNGQLSGIMQLYAHTPCFIPENEMNDPEMKSFINEHKT